MTDAFTDWWDGEVETPDNPFEQHTPAYWAWLGWMAGAAAEREACAKIVDAAQPYGRIAWTAAAIRARGDT